MVLKERNRSVYVLSYVQYCTLLYSRLTVLLTCVTALGHYYSIIFLFHLRYLLSLYLFLIFYILYTLVPSPDQYPDMC